MMLNLNEDVVINKPIDIANALGNHLLVVDGEGKPVEGSEIPEEIYARYDTANELLYIDSRVFHWIEGIAALPVWRKDPQYCGGFKKRLATGSGKKRPPQSVVCFDLSANPNAREKPIRPRRGRPLLAERMKVRLTAAEKVNAKMLDFHRRVVELQSRYEDHPLLEEAVGMMEEAKAVLQQANEILIEGRRRGIDKKRNARPKKTVPVEERIKLDALDAFLQDNIKSIHRILKKTVVEDGKPRWAEKQIRPDIPIERWVGRYEDIAEADKAPLKQLFVPLALLKAFPELAAFRSDYRFKGMIYRRVGNTTAYCAAFDFARPYKKV